MNHISKAKKNKVIEKLIKGYNCKKISKELGLKYQTVLAISKEVDDASREENINIIKDLPDEGLAIVADLIDDKKDLPVIVRSKLKEVATGGNKLKKLESKFQDLLSETVDRASEFLKEDNLTPKEFTDIAKTIGTIYKDVFNQKGMNVQINNGDNIGISNQSLNVFKKSLS